jgi:hypothetical protein
MKYLGPIMDFVSTQGGNLGDLVTGPIGGLVQGATGGVGGIGSTPAGGKPKGFSGVPRLATGGIVTAPTLALIGEAGPEAVIPLGSRNGMGGNTYQISVQALDASQASTAVIEAIKLYERRNGPGWRAA